MNFVVEDGTGKTDATSYCTIEFIDSYADDLGYSEWDSYSLPVKQTYANQATQYIDLSFNFSGKKTDEDNALEFPRQECYNSCSGLYFENDFIPVNLKKAVAEIAINRGLSDSRLILSSNETFKREKVGDIEVERFSNGTVQVQYPQVNSLLRCFGNYNLGMRSVDLVRS